MQDNKEILDVDTAENVEQIRNIIFGTKIGEFEESVSNLDTKINVLEENIKKYIVKSQLKIKTDNQRVFDMLESRMNILDETMQKDKIKMAELINTRDINIQSQLNRQSELFSAKFTMIKENFYDEKKILDERLDGMKEEISKILNNEISSLTQTKLSKSVMSEMFLDIAMRLQESNMSDMIKEGIKTEK